MDKRYEYIAGESDDWVVFSEMTEGGAPVQDWVATVSTETVAILLVEMLIRTDQQRERLDAAAA